MVNAGRMMTGICLFLAEFRRNTRCLYVLEKGRFTDCETQVGCLQTPCNDDKIFERVDESFFICSLPEMAVRPEGGVQMSKYEVMYIINANVEEEKRSALIEQLNGIIASEGGKVTKTTEWGMRDFAYEIDDMTKGYYVIVTFEAENAGLKEFDRLMRINPSIVRFMIVNIDDKPETKESK